MKHLIPTDFKVFNVQRDKNQGAIFMTSDIVMGSPGKISFTWITEAGAEIQHPAYPHGIATIPGNYTTELSPEKAADIYSMIRQAAPNDFMAFDLLGPFHIAGLDAWSCWEI